MSINQLDNEAPVANSKYFTENNAPNAFPEYQSFYFQDEIDAARFSKYYPYQILLLIADKDPTTGEVNYSPTGWRFTLPIPPQDLTINMPIATTIQPTLNGIVEQHGGAPFRDIILSGTTGITPIKNNAGPTEGDNLVNALSSTRNFCWYSPGP